MHVIVKAGLLALAAVLVLPGQAAEPPDEPQQPLVLIVEPAASAPAQTICVLQDGRTQQLQLDTYLTQVVLSEMPSAFADAALQAQAVAARTFAFRQAASGKHADADVCADSTCCQACRSIDDLRTRYGSGFDAAWRKASEAVQTTKGEVLLYEGALIDAVYFSCSGGSTEPAAAVWGADVPYLQAVESPGEQDAAKYESMRFVSAEQFSETLRALDGSIRLPDDPAEWVQAFTRTPGGGADTLTIGGCAFSGTQLRRAFGLNSTKFTLTYRNGGFCFDVLGYGHRVGMSQYGADAIARLGFDYKTILRYYYRGVSIGPLPDDAQPL